MATHLSIRPSILRWLAAPILGFLSLSLLAVLNRGEEWIATAGEGQGLPVIHVDGEPMRLDDPARLAQAFRTARHLQTGDSMGVILELGHLLRLEVDPGTRLGCPNPPGRLVDSEVLLTLIEGTFRVIKGPAFGKRRLVAITPEARMEIDSPLIALNRRGAVSRVDVYEGEVLVGVKAGRDPYVVRAGKSGLVRAQDDSVFVEAGAPERFRRLARIRSRGSW